MTTTHTPTATAGGTAAAVAPAAADQALAEKCTSHAAYLAGLIAAGMLEAHARPDQLPTALFPDADPDLVRAVWDIALPVGYHAGLTAAQPRWTADTLTRAHDQLARAGYAAMAHLAARSANTHRPAADTHRAGGHP
ncbi:hypothetical protein [Streptomyces sp. NPDC101145]|uniref:hypothetical protein n=1 Tax=Streptomyces sp. NPDC101145 TaxID=3366112 RepID=UPI003808E02A